MKPTLRKPAGVLGIVAGLVAYAVIVTSGPIERLPVLVQAVVYLILGVLWIVPLRPLLIWMETGRWSVPK